MTLTLAIKPVPIFRDPPLLLLEARAAHGALRPARVMLAAAHEDITFALRVCRVAVVRVPVAHAPTADTDVFDTVKVLNKQNKMMY